MKLKDMLTLGKRPLTFNGLTRKQIEESRVYENCGDSYLVCARPRKPTKEMLSRKITAGVLAQIVDEKFLCILCNHLMGTPVIIKTCGHKFCEECIEKYRL